MAQLAQSLSLNLAYALSGDAKLPANLLQSATTAILKTKAKL
jgi:hypothetical protein